MTRIQFLREITLPISKAVAAFLAYSCLLTYAFAATSVGCKPKDLPGRGESWLCTGCNLRTDLIYQNGGTMQMDSQVVAFILNAVNSALPSDFNVTPGSIYKDKHWVGGNSLAVCDGETCIMTTFTGIVGSNSWIFDYSFPDVGGCYHNGPSGTPTDVTDQNGAPGGSAYGDYVAGFKVTGVYVYIDYYTNGVYTGESDGPFFVVTGFELADGGTAAAVATALAMLRYPKQL